MSSLVIQKSHQIISQAATSLASRWSETARAICSWNGVANNVYKYTSEENYVVIIDNMMNLDLLYYAAEKTGNKDLARIATMHAETSLKYHVRPANST